MMVNVPKAIQRVFGVVPGIKFLILIGEVFVDVIIVHDILLIFPRVKNDKNLF